MTHCTIGAAILVVLLFVPSIINQPISLGAALPRVEGRLGAPFAASAERLPPTFGISGPIVAPNGGCKTPLVGAADCRLASLVAAAPLSPAGESWTTVTPNTTLPALAGASMAYDAKDGYAVVFGGVCGTTCPRGVGQTWTFANGTWTNRTGSIGTKAPYDRAWAAMTYDPIDQYIVLFGGEANGSTAYGFGDTWTFANGNWTKLSPSAAPSQRESAEFVWDAADGYGLLFGGWTPQPGGGPYEGDTWKFLHGQWTRLSPTSSPTARYLDMLAWDPVDGYAVLYGGYGPSSAPTADTWTFVGGNWTNRTATAGSLPTGIEGVGAAYDATDRYVLAFGGFQYYGLFETNVVYAFVNGTWTSLTTANTPPPQDSMPIASYAPTSGVLLVTNGVGTTYEYPAPFGATAQASAAHTYVGVPVNFSATLNGGAGPYTYLWSFGDGSTSNLSTPSHSFAIRGQYNVSLVVWDANQRQTNSSVLELVIPAFVLLAISNVSETDVGLPVWFNATVSGGQGANTTIWSFGDGVLLPGRSVRHAYATPGPETVKVWTNDSLRDSRTAMLPITIFTPPAVPGFNVTPATPEVGVTSRFLLNASGGVPPLTYNWTGLPGGCAAANTAALVCVPLLSGLASIGARITDARGISAAGSVNILVVAALGLSVSASVPTPRCQSTLTVELSATLTGGVAPATVVWGFGDGSSAPAHGVSVAHAFVSNRSYVVTATAADVDAARIMVNQTVWVNATGCGPGGSVGNGNAPTPGAPIWTYLLAGVVAAIVATVGVVLTRRRRGRSTGPEKEPPGEDELELGEGSESFP